MNNLKMTTTIQDIKNNPEFNKVGNFGKLRVFRHQHTNFDELVKTYNKNKNYMKLMLEMKNLVNEVIPGLNYYMEKHYNDKLEMNK